MLLRYLAERRSWIALFAAQQLLLLFLAWIDPAIPFGPAAYAVFLSALVFLLFLYYRFHRETRFYRRLEELSPDPENTDLPDAERPFERIVRDSLAARGDRQREVLTEARTSAERRRDELTSWIHEVKTPLTAMKLIIDRMDDGDHKSAMAYEWLRIHLLLDKQLHMERMSELENDLHIRRVPLEPVIVGEIRALRSWCISKGIGFDLDLSVEEVLCDAKWLAFILRQLLSNAVKYGAPGSDIVIRSGSADGFAYIEVTNEGAGIDARDLPRVFDRGFTSAAKPQGDSATGMGLYLARRAADALQLALEAESYPGGPTTFTVRFPARNAYSAVTDD